MSSEEMYREVILDNFRNPRNYGTLKHADAHSRDLNPLCGDEIDIYLAIKENKIEDIRFTGSGCAISQASASILTDEVKGKTLDGVKKMGKDDVLNMLGVEVSPARISCALLGLKVLKMAVYSYMGQKMADEEAEKL